MLMCRINSHGSLFSRMFFQLYTEVEQFFRFRPYKPDKKDRKRIKRASKKFLWKGRLQEVD